MRYLHLCLKVGEAQEERAQCTKKKKKKKSHYELSGIREGEGKKVHEILPPTCQIIGNFYI